MIQRILQQINLDLFLIKKTIIISSNCRALAVSRKKHLFTKTKNTS